MVQFVHPVEKISFISRDTTDRRAFGYIVEGEKNKFHFFGIKTGNAAEGLVLALRDLFQVVYDIKQKEKNAGKQQGMRFLFVYLVLQPISDSINSHSLWTILWTIWGLVDGPRWTRTFILSFFQSLITSFLQLEK